MPAAIRHLIGGDREAAERALGLNLPDGFPTAGEVAGFLPVQLARIEASPGLRGWGARLMVTRYAQVAGHCGFHGPPAVIGRAEIGYTVFEPFRGLGFAQEAASALVEWAFEQGQEEVFAAVAPGNAPSLAVIHKLGFEQVGTQEDEVDGAELVFAIRREAWARR